MKNAKIGVVMVAQNDSETIERVIKSFYDSVERIVVSTDLNKGWTGKAIKPDNTIDIVKSLDVDKKIDILCDDFYFYEDPLKNDIRQRQITSDFLSDKISDLDWTLQVDADEEFTDFTAVADYLSQTPDYVRCVKWQMIQIFNTTEDGKLLIVVDENENLNIYSYYLAHRPKAKFVGCRIPALHSLPLNRQTLRLNEILMRMNTVFGLIREPVVKNGLTLHYTFAKSEKRIAEKLKTWGHSKEFNTDDFFDLWKRSKTNWKDIRDFHPQIPQNWKALKAFTADELKQTQVLK